VWETARLRLDRAWLNGITDAKPLGKNRFLAQDDPRQARGKPGAISGPGIYFMVLDYEKGGLLSADRSGCFSAMQKRGVPRLHGNMLPGNSFPQICVVSGSIIGGVQSFAQEYLRAMAQSNILFTDE
jgi:hypothetical protein